MIGQQLQQMAKQSFLSKISMFPYSNLGRINGEEFSNNFYGGLLTIIVVGVLVLTSVLKISEMFQKTTIIAKQSSKVNVIPPMINITTVKGNSYHIPYMFGLGFYQDAFYSSSSNITAEYVEVYGPFKNGNRTTIRTTINLQSCTIDHFSGIPNIQQNAQIWGLYGWLCLPMNLTLELGGSYQLTQSYKRLQINITCDQAQNCQDCGRVILYTLSRFVNPSGQQPSNFYLAQDQFMVKAQQSYTYTSRISMNHLNVDDSFMPTAKITTTSGISTEPSYLKEFTTISELAMIQTKLYIQVGNKDFTYYRSYMKLLDVLSYTGGIFNAVLVLGFLLSGYNKYFFEMNFATQYFGINSVEKASFIGYVKSTFYGIVKGTVFEPKSPDWQPIKRKRQMIHTANKMLDVINLNKRIVFLQQAISTLFQRHQIKSLHLLNSITFEQAEERLSNHKLRERLIYFLFKNQKRKPENVENPIISKNSLDQKKTMKKQINSSNECTNFRFGEKYYKESKNNRFHEQEIKSQKPLKILTMNEDIKQDMANHIFGHNRKTEPPQTQRQSESNRMSIEQLEAEMNEMTEQDLNKEELVADIENDLRRLIDQAKAGSNPVSSHIYSRIDTLLKMELEEFIQQKREKNMQGSKKIIREIKLL